VIVLPKRFFSCRFCLIYIIKKLSCHVDIRGVDFGGLPELKCSIDNFIIFKVPVTLLINIKYYMNSAVNKDSNQTIKKFIENLEKFDYH